MNPYAKASFEECRTAGKLVRAVLPRASHGDWTPPGNRPGVLGYLHAADGGRAAELLPLRYARMTASPFGFLRGAAALMAHDLSSTQTTGWQQMSGDAHLANFGSFATPERELVFDLNDFDETLRGPWEWDLKRLATSVILVGRANRLPSAACTSAALATARSYRLALRGESASVGNVRRPEWLGARSGSRAIR